MASCEIAVVTDLPSRVTRSLHPDLVVTHPYVNGQGISLEEDKIKPQKIIDMMFTDKISVKSSAPAPGELIKLYGTVLSTPDINNILHVTIGSEMSTGYAAAIHVAASEFLDKVHLFDSQTVFDGTGLLAGEALQLAYEGKGIKTILHELERFRERIAVFSYLEYPEFAIAGGRIGSKIASALARLSGLKAVVQMDHNMPTNRGNGLIRKRSDGVRQLAEAVNTVGDGRSVERVIFTETPLPTKADTRQLSLHPDTERHIIWDSIKNKTSSATMTEVPVTSSLTVHLGPLAHGLVVLYGRH